MPLSASRSVAVYCLGLVLTMVTGTLKDGCESEVSSHVDSPDENICFLQTGINWQGATGFSHTFEFDTGPPQRDIRPSEGATPVRFGVRFKQSHGIDFVREEFTVDAVIEAGWYDPRSSALVPDGRSTLRLSTEDAAKEMWLPDLIIANAANIFEPVTSSVLIARDGTCIQVDRGLVTLKVPFEYTRFPFDTQLLRLILASGTYMSDELELVPSTGPSLLELDSSLFDGWFMVNTSLHSFEETDGLLQKSRGVFDVVIRRHTAQYFSSIFVPSFMLTVLAYMAVSLPSTPPFVMPRVTLTVIALLSQVTLAQKAMTLMPPGQHSCMHSHIETTMWLHFLLLLLDANVLSTTGRGGSHGYADTLDRFVQGSFPIVATTTMCATWFAGVWASRACVIIIASMYTAFFGFVLNKMEPRGYEQK